MKHKTAVIAALFVLGAWAQAQCPVCTTCHDFCTTHDGYSSSPFLQDCTQPKTCGVPSRLKEAYLDSANPGLLARADRLSLVIDAVVPGSPADRAGIIPGDRIMLLNGENPVHSCSAHHWPSKSNPTVADIILMHKTLRREVRLQLVPVRQLLASGWSSRAQVSRVSAELPAQTDYQLWSFGFKWEVDTGSSLKVTDTLLGSPAYRSGLLMGDRILQLNGVPVDAADASLLGLLSPNESSILRITISRGQSKREVRLTAETASILLRNMARSGRPSGSATPELTAEIF